MLVIADAHIGVTKPDKLLLLMQLLDANKDEQILWLGDAFDIVMIEESYQLYQFLLKDNDIMLSGNHDYGLFAARELWVGDTYFIHGDLIDFGYIFARLEQRSKLNLVEWLVSKLRKWSLNDLYTFYDVSYDLTNDEVSYLNIDKIKSTHGYLRVLRIVLKVLGKLLATPNQESAQLALLPPAVGSAYLGYFTHDPYELFKRVLLMYPDSINASTIVMGHTHYPCDVSVDYNGKTYRFVTLGAWIGERGTTYGKFDTNGLEVIKIGS